MRSASWLVLSGPNVRYVPVSQCWASYKVGRAALTYLISPFPSLLNVRAAGKPFSLLKIYSRDSSQSRYRMGSPPSDLILYYYPFSLYSLMARYSIALIPPEMRPPVKETMVDVTRDQHLDEGYLTNINPKGQVSMAI